jgi:CDP-glucose 4,6-dehydratase
VLECLSGYLLVGKRLLEGDRECASAWNFGSGDEGALSVKEVIEALARSWDAIAWEIQEDPGNPHEARFLKLDCSRAHAELRWNPVWSVERAFARTAQWYKAFYTSGAVSSADDIRDYCRDAIDKGAVWARG